MLYAFAGSPDESTSTLAVTCLTRSRTCTDMWHGEDKPYSPTSRRSASATLQPSSTGASASSRPNQLNATNLPSPDIEDNSAVLLDCRRASRTDVCVVTAWKS